MGLIFVKATSLDAATASDTASVTLMSTDVDGIASGLQKIHDMWASIIELGLGIYLLERYVGAACFLLIIPAVCMCSSIVSPLSRLLLLIRLAPSVQLCYWQGWRRNGPGQSGLERQGAEACIDNIVSPWPNQGRKDDGAFDLR